MSKLLLPDDEITLLKGIDRRLSQGESVWEYDPDDAPGPVQGVELKVRVQEKHGKIDYRASVVWNPIAPGTCQADILAYYIVMRPCTAAGVEREAGRRKRRTFLVRKGTDLDVDVLRVDFGKLEHARKWHYQARVRVIDKARRLGDWSGWTDPALARAVANPTPPVPSGLALSFDKNEKDRHEPRWRIEAECDEIGIWDIPPQDLALFERQRVRITKFDSVTGGNFTLTYGSRTTANIAHDASAATMKTRLEDLSNLNNGDVNVTKPKAGVWEIDFVGVNNDPNQLSGSAAGLNPAARSFLIDTKTIFQRGDDDPEPVTDVRRYDFQIRRCTADGSAWITYTRGEEEHFIQRNKSKSARAEDRDNNNKVQCIFNNIRKRHHWKARVRSVALSGRGDWSDWTLVGTASETDGPPTPKHPITGVAGFLVEVDPKRVRVTWDNDTDVDDADPDLKDMHLEISHSQIQVSDRSDFSKALSDFYRADRYVGGETKAFRKKRNQRGPFWVRVRNVNGSGKKSNWITQSGNQRKKPGKVRNKKGKKNGRRFEIEYDPPNQWADATTDEWSVSEVSRYFVELRRSGATVKSKYTQSTNPGFQLTAAESKLSGYWSRVTAIGWEDEDDGSDTEAAEETAVPLDVSSPDIVDSAVISGKLTHGTFVNYADDPGFELFDPVDRKTWHLPVAEANIAAPTGGALSGVNALRMSPFGFGYVVSNNNVFPVRPGDEFVLRAFHRQETLGLGIDYEGEIQLTEYDVNMDLVSGGPALFFNGTSHVAWTEALRRYKVGPDAVFAKMSVRRQDAGGSSSTVMVIDQVGCFPIGNPSTRIFDGLMVRRTSDFTHNSTGNWLKLTYGSTTAPGAISPSWYSGGVITVPYSGVWHVDATATFAMNNSGRRELRLFKTNATTAEYAIGQEIAPSSARQATVFISKRLFLTAGDTYEIQAFQNSGGNLIMPGDVEVTFNMEFQGSPL